MRLSRGWGQALVALAPALAGALGATSARSDTGALTLGATQSNLTPKVVAFADFVTGKAAITVVGITDGTVELFPPTTSIDTRAAWACKLPVAKGVLTIDFDKMGDVDKDAGNQACANLLTSVEKTQIAVSLPGSAFYSLLELREAPRYPGTLADVFYDPSPGSQTAPAWPLALPGTVTQVERACHVHVGRWHSVPCADGKLHPVGRLRALVEAQLAQSSSLDVVAKVIDAGTGPDGDWRRFQVRPRVKPPEEQVFDLPTTCQAQIREDVQKGISPGDTFYVVCIDARVPGTPVPLTWLAHRAKEVSATRSNDFRFEAGLPVVVYAWFPRSMKELAVIELNGPTGEPPQIYDARSQERGVDAKAVTPLGLLPTRRAFGPQKGPTTTLKLSGKIGDQTVSLERTYEVETFYRGVIRFGIGVAWSPWAREIGVRTSTSGVKYAETTAGEGSIPGLFGAEFVAGYSFFLSGRMSNLVPKPAFGLSVGLGLLKQSNTLDGITSLRGGFEIAYGLDFSLALMAGFHRHDVPKETSRPGSPLPADPARIETTFGVTPGFGLILNLTPAFLKDLGLSSGG